MFKVEVICKFCVSCVGTTVICKIYCPKKYVWFCSIGHMLELRLNFV
jgi:K+ transporter